MIQKKIAVLLSVIVISASQLIADSAESFIHFRDDFTGVTPDGHYLGKVDATNWAIGGYSAGVTVADNALQLQTPGGDGTDIRVTSLTKYLYGTAEIRARFSTVGEGAFFYLGFMSREPWASNGALTMNTNSKMMSLAASKEEVKEVLNLEGISPDQWYLIKVEWSQEGVKAYVDGRQVGEIVKSEVIPDTPLPLILDVSSESGDVSMDVDWVTINGSPVGRAETSKVSTEVPLPILPAKGNERTLQSVAPKISLSENKAILENSFYRFVVSTDKGMMIDEFFNKFIERNVISDRSRLYLVHYKNRLIKNNAFALESASLDSNGKRFFSRWRTEDAPLELALEMIVDDTAEIVCKAKITNIAKSEEIFQITLPLLEYIRIGEKAADDLYYFPDESGLAGGSNFDIRGDYGFTVNMQVLDVFNPIVGGGLYTFVRDQTGTPKTMIVRKQSEKNHPPAEFFIVDPKRDIGNVFPNAAGTSMAVRHMEYQLNAGESAELPDIVIGVHKGDLREPLKRYSDWVHTWYKKDFPTPKWYMDTYAYVTAHPFGGLHLMGREKEVELEGADKGFWNPEKQRYTYSGMMGPKQKNSVMEFAMWNHYTGGEGKTLEEVIAERSGEISSSFHLGDYDYPTQRGGMVPLKEEVARIHEKEGRFLLYTYTESVWSGAKVAKEHGLAWASMGSPGQYAHRYTEEGKGWNYCMYHPDYANYFGKLMAERVEELNTDGYRQDVFSRLFHCFNPEHDHYKGTLRSAYPAEEHGKFLQTTQRLMREAKPEAVVTTEHAGNDYLTQFHDGFFVQNVAWLNGEMYDRYRALGTYRICFMRFYFPEVKMFIQGILPPKEAVNIGLFNATGLAIMPAEGPIPFDSVRENGDAVNSMIQPEPLVPTLVENLLANFFPGAPKQLWTVYNKSGRILDEDLIEVPFAENMHYVEVLNDKPVLQSSEGGKTRLRTTIQDDEVLIFVGVPRVLRTEIAGDVIKVSVPPGTSEEYKLHIAYDKDIPGDGRKIIPLKDGKADVQKSGRTIIKLMHDYYLVDQIVIE